MRLLDIGLKSAGADLAVELPFSGYGPLTEAAVALADHVVERIGPANPAFFCQANGWGPGGDWGRRCPDGGRVRPGLAAADLPRPAGHPAGRLRLAGPVSVALGERGDVLRGLRPQLPEGSQGSTRRGDRGVRGRCKERVPLPSRTTAAPGPE